MTATSVGHRDGECVRIFRVGSPLGPLVAGATPDGVCLLEFTDRRPPESDFADLRAFFGAPIGPGTNAHLETLEAELEGYFAGRVRSFSVPLVFPGTPFQRRVWERLLAIPYGETRSYVQLAAEVGAPGAARAVGSANGSNRIAIVIPCHRVITTGGGLGGYGGGLRRKQYLLDLESGGATAVRLFAPGA